MLVVKKLKGKRVGTWKWSGVNPEPCSVRSRGSWGVCLGIVPHFIWGLYPSHSHALEWHVLHSSVHAASEIQPAATTVSEANPQLSSVVSVWMGLLLFPFHTPSLQSHIKHIHFQWLSSRRRSPLFLWTDCGKLFPVVLKVLSVHTFCLGPVGAYPERDTTGRFVCVLLLMMWSQLRITRQNIGKCLNDLYLIICKEIMYFHTIRKARKAWKPFKIFVNKTMWNFIDYNILQMCL